MFVKTQNRLTLGIQKSEIVIAADSENRKK